MVNKQGGKTSNLINDSTKYNQINFESNEFEKKYVFNCFSNTESDFTIFILSGSLFHK